ncbi:MAG: hypothetical protein JW769_04440 [Parachlamydiales bacterium]|nr:hypothetical protein [Parachlamydiales bacterium]
MNIFSSHKKLIYIVVIAHCGIVMSLWVSSKISKVYHREKPLVVKEIVFEEASSREVVQPIVSPHKKSPVNTVVSSSKKNILKKEATDRTSSLHKNPVVAQSLLRKMQTSLNKIEEHQKPPLSRQVLTLPKRIEIVSQKSSPEKEQKGSFEERLIMELQSHLHLPEYGAVKLEMTITDGRIDHVYILHAQNQKNAEYLKKTLLQVSFPWFNQYSRQEKFVVLFRNEE